MGILRKLVNTIQCDTPANYGYRQSSKRLEFDVGTDNAENHNDSFIKIIFEVEGLSDDDFVFLDGKIVSFFNRVQLKQKNGARLEDLEQANRFFLSNDIQTSSPDNCKFHHDSWKHNLAQDDLDKTTGGADQDGTNNTKTPIVQGKQYVGILPVSDFTNYFKGNPLHHSYREYNISYKLHYEEDNFIFSSASVVAKDLVKLKCTEAVFHLINYEIDPVIREEVLNLKQVAQGYETYLLNSTLLKGGSQSIKWSVGQDYVVALKLIGRKAAAPDIGVIDAILLLHHYIQEI